MTSTIAAPYLDIIGYHISVGTVSELLAAAGALIASVVALRIANKQSQDRRRELEDAAFAQARLVHIDAKHAMHGSQLEITITDYGREPILDVKLLSASAKSGSTTFLSAVVSGSRKVITQYSVDRNHNHDFTAVMRNDNGDEWDRSQESFRNFDATITFADAGGRYWSKSMHSDPVRL